MGEVIAVMSGKGGVGKTTIAANLAASLEKFGKNVLIIDADLCLPNLDIVLGLTDATVWDINDVYESRCPLSTAAVVHPKHHGLSLLKAPNSEVKDTVLLTEFILRTAIENKNHYDFIIIDCPSGLGNEQKLLMRRDVKLLIVATPDTTSVADASKTACMAYEQGSTDVRLLINRIDSALIKKGLLPDVDEIIDRTYTQLIGLVPDERRIAAYSGKGILVTDMRRSNAKTAFENTAKRLMNIETALFEFWK